MVLYEVNVVKAAISETGSTNNEKLKRYGTMADNFVIGYTINVKDLPNPPVVTVDVLDTDELSQIRNFATQLAIAYFYKFESGDDVTAEAAEKAWVRWYQSKFLRPRFRSRGGELAR